MDTSTKKSAAIGVGLSLILIVGISRQTKSPLSSDNVGAPKNPAHEQLLQFNEIQQRAAFSIGFNQTGESCGEVTRTFFQNAGRSRSPLLARLM